MFSIQVKKVHDLAALPRNNISEMQIAQDVTLPSLDYLITFTQHKTQPENKDDGFLVFIRLIGTAYFKKYLAAFISLYKYDTLKHYTSLDYSLKPNAKDEVWLQEISL